MRKVVLLLLTVLCAGLFFIQCEKASPQDSKRKLLKEIVIEHSKTDSAYTHYGLVKEVYRIYNCEYKEVRVSEERTVDMNYGTEYFMNNFGDTIRITCTDYTNYPRREE